MATDDERREVARGLRKLAAENRGTLGWGRTSDAIVAAKRIMGTCGLESVAHVLERNADLIEPAPERTCRNVYDGREFECSECGSQWHLLDRADCFDEWRHVRTPPFCPSCGVKAVEE